MNKEQKKSLVAMLELDEIYMSSLEKVEDQSEKRKIQALSQEVYLTLAEALEKLFNNLEEETTPNKVEP